MSDEIDPIADAVLAVPGVVGLATDPDADSPASEVVADATSVQVVIDADASIPATADEVRRAAHDVTGGPVEVTVEEVR